MNYKNRLKKNLESLSATPRSQATFFILFINRRQLLREGLEIQLESITSNSFVSSLNIPDPTFAVAELLEADFTIWQGYHQRSGIKDSTPAACSLSKFIWKVIVCKILTGEGYLGPDIWPEVADQIEGMEDITRKVWATEAYCR